MLLLRADVLYSLSPYPTDSPREVSTQHYLRRSPTRRVVSNLQLQHNVHRREVQNRINPHILFLCTKIYLRQPTNQLERF